MKVLITGGTGFLGVYLARFFLKKNCEVTLFDIVPLKEVELKGKVKAIKGDIRNLKAVKVACKGKDYVIHAAAALPIAQSKELIYSVNLQGTKNVLKTCLENKIKKVIYISTTAVYDIHQPHPTTEQGLIKPIGYYGSSKISAEKVCQQYQQKGLQVTIVRPKTFLGPERLGVFKILFDWIYEGRKVPILGNGENYYQLLDVNELCQAIYLMLKSKYRNQTYNIGAKKFGTVREDLEYVIKKSKTKAKLIFIPAKPVQSILSLLEILKLSPLAAWHYQTANLDSYVDCKKAKRLLGWKSVVSGRDVLLDAYKWYEKHRKEFKSKIGVTHRVGWNEKLLGIVKKFM